MTATTRATTENSHQARSANTSRRWTRARNAVRQWFARTHLGPVDNYVTR